MVLKAYAVFDNKGDVFNTPFFMATNGQALRAFADLAADRNTLVGRHPGDFKLVCVGQFDDQTGVMEPVAHVSLGFASEFTVVVEPEDKIRRVQ